MATKKALQLTATFKFKRSTKGTHVYEEVDAKGEPAKNISGSLYIQRAALSGDPPETLNATLIFE